jgi:hypothetical protein
MSVERCKGADVTFRCLMAIGLSVIAYQVSAGVGII